ncbi:MAG: adenosylcobinamide-phosphate synthase CbiB [Polyangiales bacterium]
MTAARRARIVRAVSAAFFPSLLTFGCAWLVDARLQLPSALHPVAWFGKLAQLWINRAPTAPASLAFAVGLSLALGLPAGASALVWGALQLAERSHPALVVLLQLWLLFACVCLHGLLDAAHKLAVALREPDLAAARERLRWLCSRDPSELDEPALVNGAVESLAENLSDSVVAPLVYLCCLGLPGAVAYRAINTLDAMIGYHGRYEWLGKAVARLDDLANLVPARLTTLLLWLAAVSCRRSQRLGLRRGLRTWRLDRARTPSPNGGHPMAMAAGLLGVQLDKPGVYVLGAGLPAPTRVDLERAQILTRRAGFLAWVAATVILWQLGSPLV